jgi:Spy/CpxP family protein refolding chaperone
MTRSSALSALFLAFAWIASAPGQNASVQRGGLPPSPSRPATRLPARWWNDAVIAAAVGLTVAQAERIDAVFEEFAKPQRERWTAFRPLEKELDELLRQARPDEKQVIDRITMLEDKRSEMNRSRMIMLFHIQQVLSPWQRSKLQELGWSASTARGQRSPRNDR